MDTPPTLSISFQRGPVQNIRKPCNPISGILRYIVPTGRVIATVSIKVPNGRGGFEQEQYEALLVQVRDVNLVPASDHWKWSLENSGDFSVASVRKMLLLERC
ncbi:hypothetical protein Tco_1098849 [Tanacetum coccineum]